MTKEANVEKKKEAKQTHRWIECEHVVRMGNMAEYVFQWLFTYTRMHTHVIPTHMYMGTVQPKPKTMEHVLRRIFLCVFYIKTTITAREIKLYFQFLSGLWHSEYSRHTQHIETVRRKMWNRTFVVCAIFPWLIVDDFMTTK